MNTLAVWLQATRPKTLFAAVSPVALGTTFAFVDGRLHIPAALLALVGAIAIQIGTNFCNDVFDHRQGADTDQRQGPKRGLQSGQISMRSMVLATVLCFAIALTTGLFLYLRAGWPLLVIATLSVLSGVFYTAGRYSLAYTGMADVFVIVFFGPVAVAGTYFVQAPGEWPPSWVMLAGLGPGLIATSLLCVNNLRDVDEDRSNNKRTLAVRFGRGFARIEYAVCMICALILPLPTAYLAGRGWTSLAVLLLLLPAGRLMRAVREGSTGADLNPVLGKTGKMLLVYSLLFSATWMIGR